MTRTPLLAVTALLALTACAKPAAPPKVEALDPWCRPAPAGALAGACYVTLTANVADRLVAVATPAAALGEIHTMSMDGEIMRMRRLDDGLALPADRPTALKPGGDHLMLIGPTGPLADGGVVSLTLTFAKAPALTLQAPIHPAPMPGAGAHP